MSDEGKSGLLHYVGQAWLVLALAVGFGAALAGVERFTRPRILRNEKDFIARKLVELFGAGTRTDEPVVLEVPLAGRRRPVQVPCYPALRDGRRVGWGILATGQGYDTLTLLVAVDETVTRLVGFRVIKSLETAGIGDRIEKKEFYSQFEGKDARRPLEPVEEGKPTAGNQVNTISQATFSSKKGVVETINNNLAAVRAKLIAAAKEAP